MVLARSRRAAAAFGASCLLAFFAAPASGGAEGGGTVAAPVVGPERPVSEPVETGAEDDQTRPATAFDGTNHLVVWTDGRDRHDDGTGDIFGARVAANGAVLDPVGIPIATAGPGQLAPSVAFGDGVFLVVWVTGPQQSATVHGARVSPAGAVLDAGAFAISAPATNLRQPTVAYGGGTFLVGWSDNGNDDPDIKVSAARVSPAGTVLDPTAIALSTATGSQADPAISFGDSSFLVAWGDNRSGADIYGTRVSPSGAVLDPSGIRLSPASGDQYAPAIAFNGTDHLVVWAEGSTRAARVTPDGVVRDPSGITVAGLPLLGRPAVVASGPTFLVAWHDPRRGGDDVYGARIDATGRNLDPFARALATTVVSSGDVPSVALGSSGSGFFLAWEDRRYEGVDVFGTAVSTTGSPAGPGTLVSRAANSQRNVAIGFDGTNFLVVWHDNRSGRGELLAVRIAPGGEVVGRGFLIAVGGWPATSQIGFDGESFLVLWWGESGNVTASRIGPSDSVGPPIAIPLSPNQSPFSRNVHSFGSAFNGTDHLVTWGEFDDHVHTAVVRGARISRDGVLLDPSGFTIADPAIAPAVASDGTGFLVTWEFEDGLRGTRVAPDGTVLDPPGFLISPSLNMNFRTAGPVAWNGRRYLVVRSGTEPDGSQGVVATRVTREGIVEDPDGIVVAGGPGDQEAPVVAGGRPSMVAWREEGTGGSHDLHGARIGDDGRVLDVPSLVLAASDRNEAGLGLVRGSGTTWGVGYTRFVPEAPYSAERAFVRTVVAPK
jgi:hypothetical protein